MVNWDKLVLREKALGGVSKFRQINPAMGQILTEK